MSGGRGHTVEPGDVQRQAVYHAPQPTNGPARFRGRVPAPQLQYLTGSVAVSGVTPATGAMSVPRPPALALDDLPAPAAGPPTTDAFEAVQRLPATGNRASGPFTDGRPPRTRGPAWSSRTVDSAVSPSATEATQGATADRVTTPISRLDTATRTRYSLALQVGVGNRAVQRLSAANLPAGPQDGKPTLMIGSQGQSVMMLQDALNVIGGADPLLVTDGIFGENTRSAVRSFQAGQGLSRDGIVGPQTRGALARALSSDESANAASGVPGGSLEEGPALAVVNRPPAGDFGAPSACQYEPGEKEKSAADPGSAAMTNGLIPSPLDELNETRRIFLAHEFGVSLEDLDTELEKRGLPVPPPFTPAARGDLTLSGFTQGNSSLKATHMSFLKAKVAKLGLDTVDGRYKAVRIEGFTDCVDSFSMNVGIRLARATATRDGLMLAGALEENLGDPVAASSSLGIDQTSASGRAANRAAVVRLELRETRRPEPNPEIPGHENPTCQEPSDEWSFTTITSGGGGAGLGAGGLVIAFHNKKTGCSHRGIFGGAGFASPGAGISLSKPGVSDINPLLEEAFSFQLSGFGVLAFAEVGAGPGEMVGRLIISSGALAGQILNVGGFQIMTPGADLNGLFGFLSVEMDPLLIS